MGPRDTPDPQPNPDSDPKTVVETGRGPDDDD
jgi:hypothetical protein